MSSILKESMVAYVFDKRKILIFLVFAFFCGGELRIAMDTQMSLYEYLLFVMGNHYYIIYFMLMAYIYFTVDSIYGENNLIRIRIGTIRKLYINRLQIVCAQAFFYVAVHMIVAILIGSVKLENVNRFTAKPIEGYYNDTLQFLLLYRRFFRNPIVACIAVVMVMITGFVFLSMILYVVANGFGKKACMVLVGVIIFDIMVGFKSEMDGILEFFFLNYYLICHHVLYRCGIIYLISNFLVEIILIVMGYFILKRRNGNRIIRGRDCYIRELQGKTYRYSIVFLVGYVFLNSYSSFFIDGSATGIDILLENLVGYATCEINILEFIRYSLFFWIPLFFIGVTIEKKKMYYGQVILRYGSRKVWERLTEKYISEYILMYVSVFIVGIIIAAIVVGATGTSQYVIEFIQYVAIQKRDLRVILVLSCILKYIELFYYKEIFFLWSELLNNIVVAYVFTCLCAIFDFIAPHSFWISYGCSSVYQLAECMSKYGRNIIVLVIPFVLIVKVVLIKCIRLLWRRKYVCCN